MKFILFVALESEFPMEFAPRNFELYYTGIGKVNAAFKATNILSNKNPLDYIVLNYGSAGTNFLNKNTIHKCTKFQQSDIDARPLAASQGITPYDESIYPQIPSIIEFSDEGKLCSTADSFQETPLSEIVDMEAYAIAKVCKILNFPFVSYKFISDDGNLDDWKNNHHNGIDLFLQKLKTDFHIN